MRRAPRFDAPDLRPLVVALFIVAVLLLAGCACTPPLPGDPIETNPARGVTIPGMPPLNIADLTADACGTRAMLQVLGARFTRYQEKRYREICGD